VYCIRLVCVAVFRKVIYIAHFRASDNLFKVSLTCYGCVLNINPLPVCRRYELFLQLKEDVLSGKLECPFETTVELAAFALQCECMLVFMTWF